MSIRFPDISIELNDKIYVVEKIYVSELNWLMVRLWCEETRSYSTINVGKYDIKDNFITNELRRDRNVIK